MPQWRSPGLRAGLQILGDEVTRYRMHFYIGVVLPNEPNNSRALRTWRDVEAPSQLEAAEEFHRLLCGDPVNGRAMRGYTIMLEAVEELK